jgi:hypothetical protein
MDRKYREGHLRGTQVQDGSTYGARVRRVGRSEREVRRG